MAAVVPHIGERVGYGTNSIYAVGPQLRVTRLTILIGCYTILAVVPAVSHYPILYSTKGYRS